MVTNKCFHRISRPMHQSWSRCPHGAAANLIGPREKHPPRPRPGMSTFGQLVLSGIFIGSIYALMSMGLTLIFGVLRIVNFAHGEFLMLGMYGAWAITRLFGLNPYVAAIAVVPAMFLFGAIVHQ